MTPQGLSPWTELYEDHIKPVVEAAGLRCFRSDKISRPSSIIADIVEALSASFLVVAEMTGQNPNVFYELGVRHALSRRTILLSQSATDIPFDLKDNRTIIYNFTPRGAADLERALGNAIAEVLSDPDHCDNPVQSFLMGQVRADATSAELVGALELRSELASVQKQNAELFTAVAELKRLLGRPQAPARPTEIIGTWADQYLQTMEDKYLFLFGDRVVMAYGGTWPGCAWGRVAGDIYQFEWSRFDRTLGGHGVLRLMNATLLEGGLWFGSEQPTEGAQPLEKHVLSRKSLTLLPEGRQWAELAGCFLKDSEIRMPSF